MLFPSAKAAKLQNSLKTQLFSNFFQKLYITA